MIDTHAVHMALRARLEGVAEIPAPADRSWSNVPFKPSALRPHIESEMGPVASGLISFPADQGWIQYEGEYVIRYYGLTAQGESAIAAVATAILAAFPPGVGVVLDSDSNDRLRVRGDVGPSMSQIIAVEGNKSFCAITIPWRAYSQNAVFV